MNVWRSKKFHTQLTSAAADPDLSESEQNKLANHFIKNKSCWRRSHFPPKLLQKKRPRQDDLIKESKRHVQRGKRDGNMTYVESIIVKITVFTSLDIDVLLSQVIGFISAIWITSHLWHNCNAKPAPILDVLLLINIFPPQPRTKSIRFWMCFTLKPIHSLNLLRHKVSVSLQQ